MNAIRRLYQIDRVHLSDFRLRLAIGALSLSSTTIFYFTYSASSFILLCLSVVGWLLFAVARPRIRLFFEAITDGILLFVHTLTLIFLTLLYYVIFTPAGWILRRSGTSPLLERKDETLLSYRYESTPLRETTFTEPY